MSETIRYTRLGKEDLNLGTGTFEARLADGRVVILQQVDIGEILSDGDLSTRDITLDSLTVGSIVVGGGSVTGTLQAPEKADPGSPLSGEIWINSGGTVLEYADDAGTPTKHALVGDDTTQTLTNKILTSPSLNTPAISAPVITGAVTGVYSLGGTPSLAAPLDASDEDITAIDELALSNAAANPTAIGRLRRSGADLKWHNGIIPDVIVLLEAIQTLLNKTLTTPTLTTPTISNPVLSGTMTGTYTLGGTPTLPATAGASVVYLESATVSGDTAFTNLDPAYDEHVFQFVNLNSSASWILDAVVSSDNGSNYANSLYQYTLFGVVTTGASVARITQVGISSSATLGGLSGRLSIFNIASTSRVKKMLWQVTYVDSVGGTLADVAGSGFSADTSPDVLTSAVNAIKFLFSAGTPTGTIRHYGVKNS